MYVYVRARNEPARVQLRKINTVRMYVRVYT